MIVEEEKLDIVLATPAAVNYVALKRSRGK